MATVTTTFSQLSPNLKAVHTGINVIGGALSTATSLSPSGVLKMVQVPNGCTLVDFWLRIQMGETGSAQTFEIGTSQTRSGIMSITTLSQTFSISTQSAAPLLTGTIRAPGGTRGGTGAVTDLMPVRISISDDATPSSVWIMGKSSTGISASAFFTFCLFYTMDGMGGHTTIR